MSRERSRQPSARRPRRASEQPQSKRRRDQRPRPSRSSSGTLPQAPRRGRVAQLRRRCVRSAARLRAALALDGWAATTARGRAHRAATRSMPRWPNYRRRVPDDHHGTKPARRATPRQQAGRGAHAACGGAQGGRLPARVGRLPVRRVRRAVLAARGGPARAVVDGPVRRATGEVVSHGEKPESKHAAEAWDLIRRAGMMSPADVHAACNALLRRLRCGCRRGRYRELRERLRVVRTIAATRMLWT